MTQEDYQVTPTKGKKGGRWNPFSRRSKKNSGGGGRDDLSETSEHEVMEGSSQTTESSSRPSSGRGLRFGRFSRKGNQSSQQSQ